MIFLLALERSGVKMFALCYCVKREKGWSMGGGEGAARNSRVLAAIQTYHGSSCSPSTKILY